MKKVFLGGTCNGSTWRNKFVDMLLIDYFNPVVENWNKKAQEEELKQREECDYCLYVLTPKMTGLYSIAEVVDDSNKRPEKTIFCFLKKDEEDRFSPDQIKSLTAVGEMVEKNGAVWLSDLYEIAGWLNSHRSV